MLQQILIFYFVFSEQPHRRPLLSISTFTPMIFSINIRPTHTSFLSLSLSLSLSLPLEHKKGERDSTCKCVWLALKIMPISIRLAAAAITGMKKTSWWGCCCLYLPSACFSFLFLLSYCMYAFFHLPIAPVPIAVLFLLHVILLVRVYICISSCDCCT